MTAIKVAIKPMMSGKITANECNCQWVEIVETCYRDAENSQFKK